MSIIRNNGRIEKKRQVNMAEEGENLKAKNADIWSKGITSG